MTGQATQLPAASQTSMQDQTLARWNWAAFSFTWLWALSMRLWPWALIGFFWNAIFVYIFYSVRIWHTLQIGERTFGDLAWLYIACDVVFAVLLGLYGNRMAWKQRAWTNLLQFRITQLAWEKYGRPVGMIVLTLVPMYYILAYFAS